MHWPCLVLPCWSLPVRVGFDDALAAAAGAGTVVRCGQIASSSFSPVRMRSAVSIGMTKILPSPMRPVCAAAAIASTTRSASASAHDHLELHLGQEIDDVFGAAIELGVALLAAEALGLGHGDARDADFVQRLLHLVELERLDDRFDLFHVTPCAAGPGARAPDGSHHPPATILQESCQGAAARRRQSRCARKGRNCAESRSVARDGAKSAAPAAVGNGQNSGRCCLKFGQSQPQAGRFVEPGHQVERLHRRAAGALAEVVEHRDQPRLRAVGARRRHRGPARRSARPSGAAAARRRARAPIRTTAAGAVERGERSRASPRACRRRASRRAAAALRPPCRGAPGPPPGANSGGVREAAALLHLGHVLVAEAERIAAPGDVGDRPRTARSAPCRRPNSRRPRCRCRASRPAAARRAPAARRAR